MHAPDPRVGMVLGERYLVRERLNEGSMGVVYRGERVGLGRPVAIKFLNESYAASDDGVRRFDVEARAMSRLTHPNCVAVTDFGIEQGAPYLVMDFVTGLTLRQVLLAELALAPDRAVEIVRGILAGLAHAHGHAIIHRDVKPENVIVSRTEGHGEQVRILDFGLAKLRNEGSVTTGLALGTPSYMSPEQTAGLKVDERADVYAAGVILFELITGKKPFAAASPFEVMRMHREVPPPPLVAASPGHQPSAELIAAVERALAKSRDARFASAHAFRAALEATPEGRGRGQLGTPARLAIAGGVAAAALGVVAFGAWWSGRGDGVAPWLPVGAAPTAVATPVEAAEAPPAAGAAPASAGTPASGGRGEPADVAALRARAEDGDRAGAVAELEALRAVAPRRAEVHHALGGIYAELASWRQSVVSYGAALSLEPGYAADARLVGDVVEALASEDAHEQATYIITRLLGAAALPRLEMATRSASPELRERAASLRDRLAATPAP